MSLAAQVTEIVDDVIIVLRIIAAVLAVYNLTWTFAGARALVTGNWRPPQIYLSILFWFAVVVLVFQASYLAGQTTAWRLFAYTILATSMGLAALGHRIGATMKARQFYAAFDHLGVATAMVDLARVDPVAADALAAECRRLTAAKVVKA